MDALKKAAQKVGGGGSDSKNQQAMPQGQGGSGSAGQKDDYVDKAFSAGVQKSGYNIDRQQQEKITDAGRGAFEKSTGKQIPDKFSN